VPLPECDRRKGVRRRRVLDQRDLVAFERFREGVAQSAGLLDTADLVSAVASDHGVIDASEADRRGVRSERDELVVLLEVQNPTYFSTSRQPGWQRETRLKGGCANERFPRSPSIAVVTNYQMDNPLNLQTFTSTVVNRLGLVKNNAQPKGEGMAFLSGVGRVI
jgi:hypothetical protein